MIECRPSTGLPVRETLDEGGRVVNRVYSSNLNRNVLRIYVCARARARVYVFVCVCVCACVGARERVRVSMRLCNNPEKLASS